MNLNIYFTEKDIRPYCDLDLYCKIEKVDMYQLITDKDNNSRNARKIVNPLVQFITKAIKV